MFAWLRQHALIRESIQIIIQKKVPTCANADAKVSWLCRTHKRHR